jgi:hypothetical protein|tara:strand:+ start:693 stop:989 length:297 start_codon:yes stop_codon:yes gene_type:complete
MTRKTYTQTLHKRDKNRLSDYVTVGDIINGKPITEIWTTSYGNVRYEIGGVSYDFADVLKELKKQEEEEQQDDEYWEGVMAEDQYETMRQIEMDNGGL